MTIHDAKLAAAERLRSWVYFSDIPIFTDEEQDIRGAIDRWNADNPTAKAGLFVTLSVPSARDNAPGVMAPAFTYTLAVQIHEDPMINRDPAKGVGKMAEEACEQALLVLRHFDNSTFCLLPDQAAGAAFRSPFAPFGFQAYVNLIKRDTETFNTVQNVAISIGGGNCSLACATAGAAIYFTMDDSFPRSGNPTAAVYAAPFAISTGQTVRACAYKDESGITWIPSNVTEATA